MENSSVVCSLLALLSYHFGVLFSILAVTYLLCPNSSAVGQCRWLGFTRPSPTSRGLGRFVSFLFRRQSAYTADGPRAGAVRLRRSGDGRRGKTDDGSPKPPQAASPCSWTCRRLPVSPPQPTRTAAHPPPARGAGVRLHGAEGTVSRPPCSWGGCASDLSHRHCQPALPAEFNLQAPLQTPSSRYNNGRNALKGTASASPFPKRAGNGASPAEGRGGDRPGAAGRTRMRQ